MATKAESTFYAAIAAAEGVRQSAKAAALATYSFSPAGLATYITALEAADNAYIASVNAAASTLGAGGFSTPNSGPSQGLVNPGGVGTDVISVNSSIGGAYGSATMGAIP